MSRKLLLLILVLAVSLLTLPLTAQEEEGEDAVVSAVLFNVVAADIEAANGVVHVIDSVIVPEFLTIPEMDMAEAETAETDAEATPEAEADAAETEAETDSADALPTIAGIVASSPDHAVLAAAVTAADLLPALDDPEATFTVFAPTDAAFEALLAELDMSAEDLLANTDLLLTVLGYHVIPDQVLMAADLTTLMAYDTLGGVNVEVGVGEDAVNAGLDMADMGDDAMADDTAPEATDEPAAEVTEEAADAATEDATDEAAAEAGDTSVVGVAASAGDFTTLLAAVEAAGLTETLSTGGPFTVFAPTDEAFAAALEALNLTAEDLLADTETLTSILTYHVVEGNFPSPAVAALNGQSIDTLNGAAVTISVDGETVMINEATVIQVDVSADNGVIHVIDAVLLPPTTEE